MSLKFKCPSCSCEELEVVQSNVVQTSQVVDIDEGGCFEFDLIDTDGGNVDYFQCVKCGYVLKNESEETITTELEVVEWVKKNC